MSNQPSTIPLANQQLADMAIMRGTMEPGYYIRADTPDGQSFIYRQGV